MVSTPLAVMTSKDSYIWTGFVQDSIHVRAADNLRCGMNLTVNSELIHILLAEGEVTETTDFTDQAQDFHSICHNISSGGWAMLILYQHGPCRVGRSRKVATRARAAYTCAGVQPASRAVERINDTRAAWAFTNSRSHSSKCGAGVTHHQWWSYHTEVKLRTRLARSAETLDTE